MYLLVFIPEESNKGQSLINKTAYSSYQQKSQPAFGCRLMTFMVPQSAKGQQSDEFIRQCLLESNNSLKNQAKSHRNVRDGVNDAMTLEELSGVLNEEGNPHGWGILGYLNNKLVGSPQKSIKSAETDPKYDKAVDTLIKEKPDIILAHIRLDTSKKIAINNNHPFLNGAWSFEHNGTVFIKDSEVLQDKLKEYQNKYNISAKGTTDSEQCFNYFLGKLKDYNVDTTVSGQDKSLVLKAFADTIRDIKVNTREKDKSLTGTLTNLEGNIDYLPLINFIASDGENVYAYRKGLNLFLGEYKLPNGQSDFIIASENIQPDGGTGKIKWIEIPNDTILSLSKLSDGSIKPVLADLSDVLAGKLPVSLSSMNDSPVDRFLTSIQHSPNAQKLFDFLNKEGN